MQRMKWRITNINIKPSQKFMFRFSYYGLSIHDSFISLKFIVSYLIRNNAPCYQLCFCKNENKFEKCSNKPSIHKEKMPSLLLTTSHAHLQQNAALNEKANQWLIQYTGGCMYIFICIIIKEWVMHVQKLLKFSTTTLDIKYKTKN